MRIFCFFSCAVLLGACGPKSNPSVDAAVAVDAAHPADDGSIQPDATSVHVDSGLDAAVQGDAGIDAGPPPAGHDHWVAQTALGTGDGSSPDNALASTWVSDAASWGTAAGQIEPGDRVHFVGTLTTPVTIAGSGAFGAPVTLLFDPGATFSAPSYPDHSAILAATGQSHIVIDGGLAYAVLEATQNGAGLATSRALEAVRVENGTDWVVTRLDIRGLYQRTAGSADPVDNGAAIHLLSVSNARVHDNRVSQSRAGIVYEYGTDMGIEISNNDIAHASLGIGVSSRASDVHADTVLVAHNEVHDASDWDGAAFTAVGIQVSAIPPRSVLSQLKVVGNYVHGDLGAHPIAWIELDDPALGLMDALTYDNLLVSEGTSTPTAGAIFGVGGIYNNTISLAAGGTCLALGGSGDARNNIAAGCDVGVELHPSATPHTDRNLFTFTHGYQMISVDDMGMHTSIVRAMWMTMGYDIHSRFADPAFVDPATGDFHVQMTSPAIDVGDDLSAFFLVDRDGNVRPIGDGWDIGAYERGIR